MSRHQTPVRLLTHHFETAGELSSHPRGSLWCGYLAGKTGEGPLTSRESPRSPETDLDAAGLKESGLQGSKSLVRWLTKPIFMR